MKPGCWIAIMWQVLNKTDMKLRILGNIIILSLVLSGCVKNVKPINIIQLPDENGHKTGFTCTGLAWDDLEKAWLIGDIGKLHENEEKFYPCIRVVSEDFSQINRTISLFDKFPLMKTIQGSGIDKKDGTLYICSFDENLIRHMDRKGNAIDSISIQNPTGIVYDGRNDELIVLTYDRIVRMDKTGNIKSHFKFKEKGQDQIYLFGDKLYVTYGLNYHKPQYLRVLDASGDEIQTYRMLESYAIEGVAVKDSLVYILNDGVYHEAKIPENVVVQYKISDL